MLFFKLVKAENLCSQRYEVENIKRIVSVLFKEDTYIRDSTSEFIKSHNFELNCNAWCFFNKHGYFSSISVKITKSPIDILIGSISKYNF